MAKNKQQREAEARSKQAAEATPAPTPLAAEAEVPATPAAEQPTPTATPVMAAAAPAKPEAISKQSLAIMKLVVELREKREIEVKPEMIVQDGKFILILLGEAWPTIKVGPSGGISLPEIASYKESFDTWVKADELLAKKVVRAAKAAAAIAPAVPVPAKQEEVKQEVAA